MRRAYWLVMAVLLVRCYEAAENPNGAKDPDGSPASTVPREACSPLPDEGGPVDFFADIQPILGESCVRCHGGVRELGSPRLNLQSRDRAGFVLGDASDTCSSELYRRVVVANDGLRMPLGAQPLSSDQIRLLGRWIRQGAPWPRHWAFAPLAKTDPASLNVSDEAWVKTPIDRFILSRLNRENLPPSPEADRTTLLRRVSLDLTGLSPTPQEVDDFIADNSANSYEKVVDRLLQSPAFGETWGRHWLDQARYADSDGYERDPPRPNAWRWRDWVVDSFNRDQPFDQFTIEQLAGDLLPNATSSQILATGFHRQAMINREDGVDPEEDRTKRVIDRVATVGSTWLGLTLGCAQCHSHPYDPIEQKEFYELYAFFNNANEVSLPVAESARAPGGSGDVIGETTARSTYLLVRGNFLNPDTTEALLPGTPAVLHPLRPRLATRPTRFDLASWMVDAENPLTPRVAVNTIWYHLFGRGIVTTLDDFGARARLPSHPELLDWLADDFVSHGWRRKRVIKQIVMSSTYRQSAAMREDSARDGENALLSRQNRIRVPAEAVIDGVLGASGLLAAKDGGPCVFPPIPPELLNITFSGTAWPASEGADKHRRALYTFHQRSIPYPQLQVFDRPSASSSITGRTRSNTPLQALTTMHNVVFVEAAQALAERVQSEKPGDRRAQIVLAFRLTVSRTPDEGEIAEVQSLLDDSIKTFEPDPESAAKVVGNYAPADVAPAVAAAWVLAAQTILNLDESITRE